MNHIGQHSEVHQPHMATAYHQPPGTGPPPAIGHYAPYQPPLLQPGPPQTYPPTPSSYGHQPYASQAPYPVTSSMSNNLVSPMALPSLQSTAVNTQYNTAQHHDTTGQIAPPGMKPRVTATLWEDEGSLCFQVEAKGVCVARREDNHMINGTKLLNVAGMTRGRRDGILKSEKTRHVVKIGPMHLKGVWIPFDRALDFANKEKITEMLYPLFVHDIGALLYHPSNQPRPGMANTSAMAAVDRRRSDARYIGAPPTSSAPPLHHHHSMSTPMSQPPHSIASHAAAGRPSLDRAHTFPTPPTSASSNFGVPHNSSYEWSNGAQPLQIDTGLSNTRSVPTTPASTPPGTTIGGVHQYQTSQSYDSARQMYTAPAQPYSSQMRQFGGPLASTTAKTEMAPPPRAGEAEHAPDQKPQDGAVDSAEHDSPYAHPQAAYGANRGSYTYNPNAPAVSRVTEDVNSSPNQNGSGRATPRSAAEPSWQSGYGAPGNVAPTGNVYNPVEPRSNGEAYFPSSYVNGSMPSAKRVREMDDDAEDDTLKRQKTGHEEGGPVGGGSPYNSINRPRVQPVSQKNRR